MTTRYRVIADNPTYTDMGAVPSVFSKDDILRSQDGTAASACVDSDGDVYMVHADDPHKGGHIAFVQLQEITEPTAPAPDDSHSIADLLAAATLLDLSAELAKILRIVGALRDLETTVRETRA